MRRRYWWLVTIVGGIIFALAICWSPSEPQCRSKPLSVWLAGFESETQTIRLESAEALQQIGTNAVPQLISMLRQPAKPSETQWKQKLRTLLAKQSLVKISIPRPPDHRSRALAALAALGTQAKEAVPTLEGLLRESPPDHRALLVLAGIGPEARPVLQRALTHKENSIRLGAQVSLQMQPTISRSQSGEDSEFMRRTCEFNAQVLRAALKDYQARHPEQFTADGRPRPELPPGFNPAAPSETDGTIAPLPPRRPGYE